MKSALASFLVAALSVASANYAPSIAGARADSEALLKNTIALSGDLQVINEVGKGVPADDLFWSLALHEAGHHAFYCVTDLVRLLQLEYQVTCATDRALVRSFYLSAKDLALPQLDEAIDTAGHIQSSARDPALVNAANGLRVDLRAARAAIERAGR